MTIQHDETARQSDLMDTARANALAATLGLPNRFETGAPLPPFFHQIYFWDARPAEALGRDGHPKVGAGLIPDLGLPRRMWAGGRLTFSQPLRAGIPAEKVSRCLSITQKTGRSGPLAFVTLAHDIWQDGALVVQEEQDLVYRPDADPDAPQPSETYTDQPAEITRDLHFDPTMLFRYSALTFNGHRIHYDADYARTVEGYDGLVVHGPLLAQCLMLLAEEHSAPLTKFAFRGAAPLMHHEMARLCGSGTGYWVQTAGGRLIMSAEASFE